MSAYYTPPRAPRRLQLRRTKGWRKPPNSVVCGRPGIFSNPWRVLPGIPAEIVVERFREWLASPDGCGPELVARRSHLLARLPELRGKDLLCWCKEGAACHADVLLEIANR